MDSRYSATVARPTSLSFTESSKSSTIVSALSERALERNGRLSPGMKWTERLRRCSWRGVMLEKDRWVLLLMCADVDDDAMTSERCAWRREWRSISEISKMISL